MPNTTQLSGRSVRRRAASRLSVLFVATTACTAAMHPRQGANDRLASNHPCRTPDSLTAAHLHYVRRNAISMRPDDVNWRAPAIPHITDTTTAIAVVSDAAICRRALRYYKGEQPADPDVSEIEVIRLDSLFVISDPAFQPRGSEGAGRFVVNTAMRFVQAYLY